jgi:hypothetical protein
MSGEEGRAFFRGMIAQHQQFERNRQHAEGQAAG